MSFVQKVDKFFEYFLFVDIFFDKIILFEDFFNFIKRLCED